MAESLESQFRSFYAGKRIFLTGHTGFKGAWLAIWLSELGAEVTGYSLEAPTRPSLFEEAGGAAVVHRHLLGDIRDTSRLREAMMAARPEIVLHLAAQSLVRRSYAEPHCTWDTNVIGTINVMEAVRQTGGVRVLQVITTDKCYENREWAYAYRENDPLGGYDPYSASKAAAEIAVASWRQSFFPPADLARHGVSVSSARAGNVIGGGDWAEDRIVPDCIRALEKKQAIIVRNPGAVRPFQHVLEPLAGYLSLARAQWQDGAAFAQAFNFGPLPDSCICVRELAERVISAWGSGVWEGPKSQPAQPHEANVLKLDVTKAMSVLGWRPRWDVAHAIDRTVCWYRDRHSMRDTFDARALCLAQLRAYGANS